MIQYVSCADPSESAARKERMRFVEESGEADMVLRNIALTAMMAEPEPRNNTREENSSLRLPVSEWLGPIPPTGGEEEEGPLRIPAKKRFGRPPLNKNRTPSTTAPTVGTGSTSRKRRVTQVRGSPKRRIRTPPTSSALAKTTKTKATKTSEAKGANTGQQNQHPTTQIIPPVERRTVDFQNPPALVP